MSQHEALVDDDTPEIDRAAIVETEARRSGWRPLSEWHGDPAQWRSAEEFLARGDELLPITRQRLDEERRKNAQLTRDVADLNRKTADMELTMREVLEMARKSEGRGYERARRELEARQREAAASGDVAAFDETKAALADLEREHKPDPIPPRREAAPVPANVAPEVAAFVQANPWFTTDRVLNAAMMEEHVRLNAEAPGLALTENLEQAKAAVMAQFPAKFGIKPDAPPQPRNEPVVQRRTPVQRPTDAAGPRAVDQFKIDSIQDPDERAQARKAFARQQRSMPDFTERDYMLLYNDPHADVVQDILDQKAQKARRA